MILHRTYCPVRLGDNLVSLHFLRALAKLHPDHHFRHYAHLQYIHQLAEVVADLPNVQVCSLESVDDGTCDFWNMKPGFTDSVNTWKNADGFWAIHLAASQQEYSEFFLGFFRLLAARLGLESPFTRAEDLLFDYPALKSGTFPKFDLLFINSTPLSGQWPEFDAMKLNKLIGELAVRYDIVTTAPTTIPVPCTTARCMTVSNIGSISRYCKYIVCVSTGPSWPTFNVFNFDSVEFRLVLIGDERINLSPHTEHASTVGEARRVLQLQGLL